MDKFTNFVLSGKSTFLHKLPKKNPLVKISPLKLNNNGFTLQIFVEFAMSSDWLSGCLLRLVN